MKRKLIALKEEKYNIQKPEENRKTNLNVKIRINIGIRNQPKKYQTIYKLLILIEFFIQIIQSNIVQSNNLEFSKITLKIKGIGNKRIFCHNTERYISAYYPDEVFINGIKQTVIKFDNYLNESNNTVELIWNRHITSCDFMFAECHDITEVDLSNFNSSGITRTTSMFSNCKSLTSINFTNFDTSNVKYINRMFEKCSSLTSIDLSNFDTSKVIWMNHIFYNCSSLKELDISNFNTSKATDMEYTFSGCTKLTYLDLSKYDTSSCRQMHGIFSNCLFTSLDLSNFDTSKVTRMNSMFENCTLLKSIDLSNFNTSKLREMQDMFSGCSSLTFLNISNFVTSNVTNMSSMFYNCTSLENIDLSNFDTSNVIIMDRMFLNCSSLISLDLSNYDTSQVTNIDNIFEGCPNLEYINLSNISEIGINPSINIFDKIPGNITIYIKESSHNLLLSLLNKISCYTIVCSDEKNSVRRKIIISGSKYTDNYGYNTEYIYKYNGKCYNNDLNGFLNIENKCDCNSSDCIFCSKVTSTKDLCDKCNSDYYQIENDIFIIGGHINCYKEPKGYYLDKNYSLYKKCYNIHETCVIKGDFINHNCLLCNSNFSFIIIIAMKILWNIILIIIRIKHIIIIKIIVITTISATIVIITILATIIIISI